MARIPDRQPMSVALVIAFLPLLCAVSSAFAADRTNVVVIYADDLGYGDLGCYGHPKFKTPNLDRLAAEGARLTDFYSSCPYCAPSRAALQTGRYQFRSGVTGNPFPEHGVNDIGIPDSEITLGEAFQSTGYATCCIGKWHLGHKPQFYPLRHGYDEYLGILYSNDMRPVELWDGDKVIEYPVVQATLTRRYTERALSFIERNKDKPFFLYFPQVMVHKPLVASEAFYKKSGAGLYADALAELDWSVGQVIEKLESLGLERNTLVIFTSDNGPWHGGSTAGLRGMKGRTWEGGLRVPFIARWPGRIPAGHVSRAPAIIMDVYVTALTAAGIPVPTDRIMDGKDIMPLLTSDARSPHEFLLGIKGDEICTIRGGPWRLHIRAPGPQKEKVWKPDEKWIDPNGPDGVTILAPYEQSHPSEFPGVMTGDEFKDVALFNLDTDRAEQHNVAAEHPDVVERLRKMVNEIEKTRVQ